MTYQIRNARFTQNPDQIDLEWDHPEFGWHATTVDRTDIVQHSRELYAQAVADAIVAPYAAPTAAEVRAAMPTVTRRQLRLSLVRNGVSLASVDAVIAAMPEGQAKDEAQIEWADASTFERLHPTLTAIGAALGLSEEQIDAMWAQAAAI